MSSHGLLVEALHHSTDVEFVDGNEVLVCSGKIRATVNGEDEVKLLMAASHAASSDREVTSLSWGVATPNEYAASFHRDGDEVRIITPFKRFLGADSEVQTPKYRYSWVRDGAFAVLDLSKRQEEVMPFDVRASSDVLMLGFQVATALAAWWCLKRSCQTGTGSDADD